MLPPRSTSELTHLLGQIGWTRGELARRLGVSDSAVQGWATGRREAPENLLAWLRDVASQMAEAGAQPPDWR